MSPESKKDAKQESKTPTVRRTVFDLETFDDVTIYRPYEPEPAPQTIDEALARLGNSQEKLLSLITAGLRAEQEEKLRKLRNGDGKIDLSEWRVKDETTGVFTPYSGTPCDPGKVKFFVASMAKASFGASREQSPEERKQAKDQAKAVILSTPALKNGLAKNSAISDEEED